MLIPFPKIRYATEVDVNFVRTSVRAIGRCAIKIDSASDKCIQVLLDLIRTKVSYVVQEAIIVTRDVFRKYPRQYEGILAELCEHIETLDGPEAKCALIWIIGEYAERIDNASELLEYFSETFKEEPSTVQLQLISATVKLFLKKPSQAQELVQKVLNLATQGNENPDVRDRAYVYWRLLSTSPQAAKTVVLADKLPIQVNGNAVPSSLLSEMITHLSSLASVYYRPVSQVGQVTLMAKEVHGFDAIEATEPEATSTTVVQEAAKALGGSVGDLLDLDFGGPSAGVSVPPTAPQQGSSLGVDDLLGSVDMEPTSPNMPAPFSMPPLGGLTLESTFALPKSRYLSSESSQGLELDGTFVQKWVFF
jgi:hypothetical protein